MTEDRLAQGRGLYDHLASELCLADTAVTPSTMTGFPCLRVDGVFAATFDHRSGDLVVKLPRDRVDALVASGRGAPFAPAGRVFKEWVSIPDRNEDHWRTLLGEAFAFART